MERARRRWTGLSIRIMLFLFLGGIASPVWGSEAGSLSYTEGIWRKLGRGLANIVTCPLEVIRTPVLVGRTDGYIASLSAGTLQGLWRVIQRGVAGVVETGTFFVEIPNDFRPLMQPEFVWAHGNWAE